MAARVHLTDEQSAVRDHRAGHALVVAVAGAGKSATLIERVVALLQAGANPKRILILMFNKPAQAQFSARLAVRCAEARVAVPDVLTFHAFGLRLCEAFVAAGVMRPASILEGDSALYAAARDMMREHNEAGGADDGERLDVYGDSPREMLSVIDVLKGDMHALTGDVPGDLNPRFVRLFGPFERFREARGFRTFSDMVSDPVLLMERDPAAAAMIRDWFDHVLVDEFQDINEAQCRLLRFAAGASADVMAVGDDDQTIYTFRGARPEYMVSLFDKIFPGAHRYTLSRTFRFGHHLALCANHVIHGNDNRTAKVSVPAAADLDTAVECRMAAQRGDEVVKAVRSWLASGRRLGEAAVLVREFAHSAPTERALLAAGIPYRIAGADPFFERKIVLALRAHLQLACGGFGAVADPGRRQAMIDAFLAVPTLYLPGPLRAVMNRRLQGGSNLAPLAREALAVMKESGAHRARAFEAATRVWDTMLRHSADDDAGAVLWDAVRGHDLIALMFKGAANRVRAADNVETIKELLAMAREFQGTVAAFLAYLDGLARDHAAAGAGADAAQGEALLIMSIHRAKGLEWPLVILPELDDARFPGHDPAVVLEDERRLFYVAITRARERLVLVAPPDVEMVHWAEGERLGHPALMGAGRASRFLYEMALMRSNRLAGDLAGAAEALPMVYREHTFARPVAMPIATTNATSPAGNVRPFPAPASARQAPSTGLAALLEAVADAPDAGEAACVSEI